MENKLETKDSREEKETEENYWPIWNLTKMGNKMEIRALKEEKEREEKYNIDYYKLTSFLRRDVSFFFPWIWN